MNVFHIIKEITGTRALKSQHFNPDFNTVAGTQAPSSLFHLFTSLMGYEMTFKIDRSYYVFSKVRTYHNIVFSDILVK